MVEASKGGPGITLGINMSSSRCRISSILLVQNALISPLYLFSSPA